MAQKHLRSVTPGETAPPKFKNITEAIDGTSRDVMAAMRTALAKQLDEGKIAGNAIASAYRELRELDRLIRLADSAVAESHEKPRGDVDESFDSSAV